MGARSHGRAGHAGTRPTLNAAAPRARRIELLRRPASSLVFTSSAIPCRRFALRQRSEQRLVDHRRAPASGTPRRGSCPRGCRCRSCRRSPRLPAPTRRRRHRDPCDAAQVGRRGKAGEIGRAAAAEGDQVPPAVQAELPARAADAGDGLRLLARRKLVRRRRAAAPSASWATGAVDAHDGASATSATGPSPGTSSPSRSERAGLVPGAGGGEHGPSRVVGDGIGELG